MKFELSIIWLGFFVASFNYGFGQQDIQKQWCDGVTVNAYIRNVSDCRIWIRCKGSNPPISGLCPESLYFSQEQQACTNKNNANCYVCPNITLISFEAIDNSCNRYIRCVRGVPSEHICDNGLQFNRKTGVCDLEPCEPSNDSTTERMTPTDTVTHTEVVTPTEDVTATEDATPTEDVTTTEDGTPTEDVTTTEDGTPTEDVTATEDGTLTEVTTATTDLTPTEDVTVTYVTPTRTAFPNITPPVYNTTEF